MSPFEGERSTFSVGGDFCAALQVLLLAEELRNMVWMCVGQKDEVQLQVFTHFFMQSALSKIPNATNAGWNSVHLMECTVLLWCRFTCYLTSEKYTINNQRCLLMWFCRSLGKIFLILSTNVDIVVRSHIPQLYGSSYFQN